MLNIHRIITGYLEENCYVLNIDSNALIIDPGDEADKIIKYISDNKFKVLAILITHHHFDHVGALEEIKNEYKDAKVIDYNNKSVSIEPFKFEIIKNYGHTMDSVSYYFKNDKKLFCGDFVFKGSIGRYDYENEEEMIKSLDKFKLMDKDIIVYPGHGDETSVGYELKTNPFLRGF